MYAATQLVSRETRAHEGWRGPLPHSSCALYSSPNCTPIKWLLVTMVTHHVIYDDIPWKWSVQISSWAHSFMARPEILGDRLAFVLLWLYLTTRLDGILLVSSTQLAFNSFLYINTNDLYCLLPSLLLLQRNGATFGWPRAKARNSTSVLIWLFQCCRYAFTVNQLPWRFL